MGEQTDKQATTGDMRKRPVSAAIKKLRNDRRFSIILGVVVVLVIFALTAGYIQNRDQVRKEDERLSQVLKEVDRLKAARKDSEAKKLLTDFMDSKPKSRKNRYAVDKQLVDISFSLNDTPGAKKWAEQGLNDAADPQYSDYYNLAYVYDRLGENEKAVEYYNKSLTKTSEISEPLLRGPMEARIKQRVQQLQGQSQ